MAKTNERAYQSKLLQHLREENFWHVVPIPDSGLNKRFGVEKVYDFGLSRKNFYVAVELKIVAGKQWGWAIDSLREHQEYYLVDAHKHRSMAYVFVYHTAQLSARNEKTFGVKQLNTLWALPIMNVIKARDEDGLTRLSPDDLDNYGYRIATEHEMNSYEFIDKAVRNYKF